MKRTVIVNKKRFYGFVAIVVLLMSIMLSLTLSFLSERSSLATSPEETREIIVREGDTVWNLAQPIARQSHRDARDIVRDIYRINGLDHSTIHPGQPLLVPNL